MARGQIMAGQYCCSECGQEVGGFICLDECPRRLALAFCPLCGAIDVVWKLLHEAPVTRFKYRAPGRRAPLVEVPSARLARSVSARILDRLANQSGVFMSSSPDPVSEDREDKYAVKVRF